MPLSRVVSEIFNVENIVRLKSEIVVTQGHRSDTIREIVFSVSVL